MVNSLSNKYQLKIRRAKRVRAKIYGTSERPRLSVHISVNNVTAQLINDDKQETIAYATTVGRKEKLNMTQKAEIVGKEIAQKAKAIKVHQVVFDRGDKLYHGRIKALAEAARKAGLEF